MFPALLRAGWEIARSDREGREMLAKLYRANDLMNGPGGEKKRNVQIIKSNEDPLSPVTKLLSAMQGPSHVSHDPYAQFMGPAIKNRHIRHAAAGLIYYVADTHPFSLLV